jgi:hypothetical protein
MKINPIGAMPKLIFKQTQKEEWCSCGHRVADCDCKAGCKCGCNKRYLGASK